MIRHVTRPCPCMTTSIIIKITRVISIGTPHWIPVSCHGVEGPMTTGYYCAIFPFCGGGKKRQKNKGILWLGYHRYPSKEENFDWTLVNTENLNDRGIFLQIADSGSYRFLVTGTKIFRIIWKLWENCQKICIRYDDIITAAGQSSQSVFPSMSW